jgi:peroxiredoxin
MKNKISYTWLILVLAAALVCGLAAPYAVAGDSLDAGDVAPDFTITTLDGETVSLSDYRGKVVFLNFWASWCPPCRAEMPSIESLKVQMAGCDFVILAVSVDSGNREKIVSKVQDYIDDNGFTFEVLIDNEQALARKYGVVSVPTTFILDESGVIVEVSRGAENWDDDARLAQFRNLSPTCSGKTTE